MKDRIGLTVLAVLIAVFAGVMYLTNREPAAEKAARLRQEMSVACLPIEIKAVPSVEERAECDLATRRFNKFMAD